jgi:hypothetical protein
LIWVRFQRERREWGREDVVFKLRRERIFDRKTSEKRLFGLKSIQRLNIESETLNFNILNLNRTKYI